MCVNTVYIYIFTFVCLFACVCVSFCMHNPNENIAFGGAAHILEGHWCMCVYIYIWVQVCVCVCARICTFLENTGMRRRGRKEKKEKGGRE